MEKKIELGQFVESFENTKMQKKGHSYGGSG